MADKDKKDGKEGTLDSSPFKKALKWTVAFIIIIAVLKLTNYILKKVDGGGSRSTAVATETKTIDEPVTVEIPLTSKWSTNFYGLVPEGASVSYYPDGCVVDYYFEQANSTVTVSNQYPIGTANFQAINVDAWSAQARVSDYQPDELKKNKRQVLVVKYTRKKTITVTAN
jgi:hypothetical protein